MTSTLIVLLPPRPTHRPDAWALGALDFALCDTRSGTPRVMREGRSALAGLPAADSLVLVLAASDVLLLPVTLTPALAAIAARQPARMRALLPSLVEDRLIDAAESCHLALAALPAPREGEPGHAVAVIERAWLRFVLESFDAHPARRVRAVPAQLCLPVGAAVRGQALGDEIVLAHRTAELAGAGWRLAAGTALPSALHESPWAAPLTWPGAGPWVDGALRAPFDVCQFEFAAGWGRGWRGLRAWRAAAAFALLALGLQIAGMNLDWARRSSEARALRAEAAALAREAVPGAVAYADAELQLARRLQDLRREHGAPAAGDFAPLASALATLLAGQPADTLRALDYRGGMLHLEFKPGFAPAALRERAAAAGWMLAPEDGGRWRLAPARPGMPA